MKTLCKSAVYYASPLCTKLVSASYLLHLFIPTSSVWCKLSALLKNIDLGLDPMKAYEVVWIFFSPGFLLNNFWVKDLSIGLLKNWFNCQTETYIITIIIVIYKILLCGASTKTFYKPKNLTVWIKLFFFSFAKQKGIIFRIFLC